MDWDPPHKPAELAETRLVSAILTGHFPINTVLPPERELALQLGVTRPTLREALQRLARDGWIEIRHGRSTRVRDYWKEGSLGVLGAIANHPTELPSSFVSNLLAVRLALAPDYTSLAVQKSAARVANFLEPYTALEDDPGIYTQADWDLHHMLTVTSGNPIFTLILNGFHALYLAVGPVYFADAKARRLSRDFYTDLRAAAEISNPEQAREIVQHVMRTSIDMWEARI